jgi:nucleoside-triphosphatase THEP1
MSAANHKPLFIITGETGSGKTTFLLGLIEELRENGLSVAGFAALSDPEDGPSGSFNMLDLASGKILPLASRKFTEGWEPSGTFYFNPEGIQLGINILEDAMMADNDLIVVDEIGPFELEGKIWAGPLTRLLESQPCPILMVVRKPLVAQVMQHWNLMDAIIIDPGQTRPDEAAILILSERGEAGHCI